MMKMNSNEQRSKKTCQKKKSVFYFENSSGFIKKIKKLEKMRKKDIKVQKK